MMTKKQLLNQCFNDLEEFKKVQHTLTVAQQKNRIHSILKQLKKVVHDKQLFKNYEHIIYNQFKVVYP